MRKVVDIASCLSLFSLVLWAFTGIHLWSPTREEGEFREVVLFLLHVAPWAGSLIARAS